MLQLQTTEGLSQQIAADWLFIIVNSVNHCYNSNTNQNGQHNENIGEVHYYHFTWNTILVDYALIWGADTSIHFLVILNI